MNVKGDVRLTEGPHEEAAHWLQAVKLYSQEYAKPFQVCACMCMYLRGVRRGGCLWGRARVVDRERVLLNSFVQPHHTHCTPPKQQRDLYLPVPASFTASGAPRSGHPPPSRPATASSCSVPASSTAAAAVAAVEAVVTEEDGHCPRCAGETAGDGTEEEQEAARTLWAEMRYCFCRARTVCACA